MAKSLAQSGHKVALDLYSKGVRAYVVQDYPSAVTLLSKASELLVEKFSDDRHESLGEVYLFYGRALLELAREEANVLGDAVPKKESKFYDDDEDEKEEEKDKDSKTNKTEAAVNGDKTEATENGDKTEATENHDKTEATENVNKTEGAASGSKSEDTQGPSAADEPDEDPTDLQLAWEVLELAKIIFEKQGDSCRKELAETLVSLGEVSLENENYETAINDMKEGLKIQLEILEEDSRAVAETYYKLGIAYSTNTHIEEAVNCFNTSLEYLNKRKTVLENMDGDKGVLDDEIEEIDALVPDIKEKIMDMKTYKEEISKIISSAEMSTASSEPAQNISHLVKRKRIPDENDEKEQAPEGCPPKKISL